MKQDLKNKKADKMKQDKANAWANIQQTKVENKNLDLNENKTSLKEKPSQKSSEKQVEKTGNVVVLKQENKTWFFLKKIMGIMVDIILYPLIIISLLTSMISITARDNTQIRSVFGYSVVTILSGSMKAGGFNVGDVVFLKEEKPEKITTTIIEKEVNSETGKEEQKVLQLGDVIAFYRYAVNAPSKGSNDLTQLLPGEEKPDIDENAPKIYDKSIKDSAIKAKSEIVFHRVVAIYMASDGTYFYETRGDSNGMVQKEIDGEKVTVPDWNSGTDGTLVNQHLVVGKYIKAPSFITAALTYMITSNGMFWIVIVPLAVVVFLQIIELMTIIFDMATEKKVLEGSLEFDSEESIKARVGREMSEYNKIYFYDISPSEQKTRVREFLWEKGFEKNPKKEAEIQNKVEKSMSLYSENRDLYWKFWIEDAQSNSLKTKLTKLQRNANIITKARNLQNKKG